MSSNKSSKVLISIIPASNSAAHHIYDMLLITNTLNAEPRFFTTRAVRTYKLRSMEHTKFESCEIQGTTVPLPKSFLSSVCTIIFT